jgi:hypothetical protein
MPSAEAATQPPEVKILVFGFNSSGKTLILAAPARQFRFGAASGITLRAQGEQQATLTEIIQKLDGSYGPLPEGRHCHSYRPDR